MTIPEFLGGGRNLFEAADETLGGSSFTHFIRIFYDNLWYGQDFQNPFYNPPHIMISERCATIKTSHI